MDSASHPRPSTSHNEPVVNVDSETFKEAAEYETDYSAAWKRDVEPSVKYWMLAGGIGFTILLGIAIGLHASDDAPSNNEASSKFAFEIPASIFAVLLVLDLLSLTFPTLSRPPLLITLASTVVRAGAMLSYAARTFDLVPNVIMAEGDWRIPIRYIDWLVTTPALIALLGSLVEAPAQMLRTTVVADMMMIVFGILARPTPPAAQWTLFVLSCMCFVVAMWGCSLML